MAILQIRVRFGQTDLYRRNFKARNINCLSDGNEKEIRKCVIVHLDVLLHSVAVDFTTVFLSAGYMSLSLQ